MHKIFRSLMVAAGLTLAASAANADGLKVGFVNSAKVIEQAPQAEAARKLLEKEFSARDRELVTAQKELQKLEERLNNDGTTLSDAERRDLERDIRAQQRDLNRLQREFREDFNIRRNEELRTLQRQAFEAILTLAKEQGYDLVLSDGVVYASDKVDLTEAVIERLKGEFKAAPSR